MRLFTQRRMSMMTDATGILRTAFTRGERKISARGLNDEMRAVRKPHRKASVIPRMTLETEKRTERQKSEVGRRERSECITDTGDGRKISSPTIRERIYHMIIQMKTDRR